MATMHQALRLYEMGFRVWARRLNPSAPKGKLRRPSKRWIESNISEQQAGMLIRMMTGQAATSWINKLPIRRLLDDPNQNPERYNQLYKAMKETYGSQWGKTIHPLIKRRAARTNR